MGSSRREMRHKRKLVCQDDINRAAQLKRASMASFALGMGSCLEILGNEKAGLRSRRIAGAARAFVCR